MRTVPSMRDRFLSSSTRNAAAVHWFRASSGGIPPRVALGRAPRPYAAAMDRSSLSQVHWTRSHGFVRAECWDTDRSDPVATAQAAFMLNRG